jgi:hypothetical protein
MGGFILFGASGHSACGQQLCMSVALSCTSAQVFGGMAAGPPAAAKYAWLASFAFDTSNVQIYKKLRCVLEPDAPAPTRVRCDFWGQVLSDGRDVGGGSALVGGPLPGVEPTGNPPHGVAPGSVPVAPSGGPGLRSAGAALAALMSCPCCTWLPGVHFGHMARSTW